MLGDLGGCKANANFGAIRQFDVIDFGILDQIADDGRRCIRIVQIDFANLILGAIGQLMMLMRYGLMCLHNL